MFPFFFLRVFVCVHPKNWLIISWPKLTVSVIVIITGNTWWGYFCCKRSIQSIPKWTPFLLQKYVDLIGVPPLSRILQFFVGEVSISQELDKSIQHVFWILQSLKSSVVCVHSHTSRWFPMNCTKRRIGVHFLNHRLGYYYLAVFAGLCQLI